MAQETLSIPAGPALKEYFESYCFSLYGSQARVDGDGWLFIPSWRENKQRINQVVKDGGHVDAGIRLARHILAKVEGREKQQAELVLERGRQLVDIFSAHRLSAIPENVRQAFQTETDWLLSEAELKPETVLLKEKQQMIYWLSKASLGEDSLGRPNSLITMNALFAARGRAWQRQGQLEYSTVPKYAHILESLILAKSFDTEVLARVKEELGRLSGIVYIRKPGWRDNGIGPTISMVGSLTWLLGQTKVRPYRPAALAARTHLESISQSWEGKVGLFDYQEAVEKAKYALQLTPAEVPTP